MAFPAEFFATAVNIANEVSQVFLGEARLLSTVWTNFDPTPGEKGATVTIPFPGTVTATDRANATITLSTLTSTSKSATLDEQPHVAFLISDYNQIRSNPIKLKDQYIQPALVAMQQYLNTKIAAKFVAATMDSYTPIASAAVKVVTPDQIRDARINMRANKVPLDDGQWSLVTPSVAYDRMLTNDNYAKYDIVAEEAAVAARRRSLVLPQLGATVIPDDNINVTTQYNSALYHKTAIGVALRAIELPNDGATQGSYINVNGIPVRMTMGYSMERGGWVIAFDYLYGIVVLRKECCHLIYSALS